ESAAIGIDVDRTRAAESIGPERQEIDLEHAVDEELVHQPSGVDGGGATVVVLIGQAHMVVEVQLRVQVTAGDADQADAAANPGRAIDTGDDAVGVLTIVQVEGEA